MSTCEEKRAERQMDNGGERQRDNGGERAVREIGD